MLRSMFAGVSGLRNHQTRMDVVGNNIANVNTAGFKKDRVTFQDMLSQTVRGASSPQDDRGGTNPAQVGLGMSLASIDTIHTDGNIESTSKNTDMAIEGDGFFIVREGNNDYYTRAGNFDFDTDGNLVIPSSGLTVMGWEEGVERIPENMSEITVRAGQPIEARATEEIIYANNLDAESEIGESIRVPIEIFDSLGRGHIVYAEFEKVGINEWSVAIDFQDDNFNPDEVTLPDNLIFDGSGKPDEASMDNFTEEINVVFQDDSAEDMEIEFDFTGLTQNANETSVLADKQDGYPAGSLRTIDIDSAGGITGVFDNGINIPLATVAIASFDNPGGLIKEGNNLYRMSNNSGDPRIGTPGSGGRGAIAPSSLEMSNVDLAEEFTNMIITQRGFQANSRIITTSDEMLQELANIKR